MEALRITGGRPLHGAVAISGAKNAALPAMCASILTAESVLLHNLPAVRDVATMAEVLRFLGAEVERESGGRCALRLERLTNPRTPYRLVKTMRASVLTLGPLLARFGEAEVSLPGGCAIGSRPIDLHIEALRQMGAEIALEHGFVHARCRRLRGAEITFDQVTVTGTENVMMAAALAEGTTVLINAAREPEIVDLAELLIKMGARISGAGSDTLRIEGVSALHAAEHRIIPDRIEAGTYLIAGLISGGQVRVEQVSPPHLSALIDKLREIGVEPRSGEDWAETGAHSKLQAADLRTAPYPGFPTDLQAQFMALMTQAHGTSVITETIFENRFMHAAELRRMGARITTEGRRAVVQGPTPLSSAKLMATDLRASASLVLAGLVAEGETIVDRVYHLDRGYADMVGKLQQLGAAVTRTRV
ncbi:MAG TPA: UDP-N-acetylglucosamine 1-carboxyvinyltransferase [Acidobacteriota bacterium]